MRDLSRRNLTYGALGAAMGSALAAGLGRTARAQPVPPPQDFSFVNPELRPIAKAILGHGSPLPKLSLEGLPAFRAAGKAFGRPVLEVPKHEQRLIPGPSGAPQVGVYLINSEAGAAKPAILHTHGGGFISGSAQMGVGDLQETAALLDCVIVTVEYRLAPEAGYAASIEDNYAALLWLYKNAAELGVDPKRIAVMGESAGGGHAALLALTARDRGEVPLALQVLIYPMLDDRTGVTHTPPKPIGSLLWTPESNQFGWRAFLGQEPGTPSVPARAVPARYKDLKGLPPAFIGVGSIDLFVEEDIDYARRLIDVGVPTELAVVPGAFHGFDGIAPQTSVAKEFTAAKLAALRRAFTSAV